MAQEAPSEKSVDTRTLLSAAIVTSFLFLLVLAMGPLGRPTLPRLPITCNRVHSGSSMKMA